MTTITLPDPDTHCFDDDSQPPKDVWSYSPELVRQIIEADRARSEKNYSYLVHEAGLQHQSSAEEMYAAHVEAEQALIAADRAQRGAPVLWRYRDSEQCVKPMAGYTPGEGWTPLYAAPPDLSASPRGLPGYAGDNKENGNEQMV